jgi:hypothetical protein
MLFAALALVFTLTTVNAAVLVVSTRGEAAYRDGAAWKPLAKGQTIKEGTMVMTGVNSQAVLNIDDNLLTVKPLTTIKVLKNSFTKSSSDNVIGLKNGSVNARVKRIGTLKTRFNIVTPVATSSVRGTDETVSHGPGLRYRNGGADRPHQRLKQERREPQRGRALLFQSAPRQHAARSAARRSS